MATKVPGVQRVSAALLSYWQYNEDENNDESRSLMILSVSLGEVGLPGLQGPAGEKGTKGSMGESQNLSDDVTVTEKTERD